jgi:hypothetical protein
LPIQNWQPLSWILYGTCKKKNSNTVCLCKEAGSYTATFDGSRLASGMYFARMIVNPSDGSKPATAGKQIVQVKKMLMMKCRSQFNEVPYHGTDGKNNG